MRAPWLCRMVLISSTSPRLAAASRLLKSFMATCSVPDGARSLLRCTPDTHMPDYEPASLRDWSRMALFGVAGETPALHREPLLLPVRQSARRPRRPGGFHLLFEFAE